MAIEKLNNAPGRDHHGHFYARCTGTKRGALVLERPKLEAGNRTFSAFWVK